MKTKRIISAILFTFLLTMMCGMMSMASALVPKVTNNTTNATAEANSYTLSLAANQTERVYPVQIPNRGAINLHVSAAGLSSGIDVELFSDSRCTQEVGYGAYISSSSLTSSRTIKVVRGGTYYLKISRWSYGASAAVSINARLSFYNGADKNLGTSYAATYGVDSNTIVYHKVNVKNAGHLRVEGSEHYSWGKAGMYVTLYNSKKKPVSESKYVSSYNNYTADFGVAKGTYYIGVKTEGLYSMRSKVTRVKTKNISSRKRAATLNRNKAAKGLFVVGTSGNTHWYRVRVTKARKLKLTLNSKATGSIRVTLVNGYGSMSTYDTGSSTNSTTKLRRGTYFFKVTRDKKTTSGHYTLRWK